MSGNLYLLFGPSIFFVIGTLACAIFFWRVNLAYNWQMRYHEFYYSHTDAGKYVNLQNSMVFKLHIWSYDQAFGEVESFSVLSGATRVMSLNDH
jgi:hypothetical protein